MVQIPHFPESQHPIVQDLFHYTDPDLLTLFQRHPDQGRYFVGLFCRYHTLVYKLIQHSVRSPVQADYLFAITWRHIYHELRGLDLASLLSLAPNQDSPNQHGKQQSFNLQSWLVKITAVCINHAKLPPVESIHYSLSEASPPLWCYLDQALNRLSPLHRLTVLMAHTFHWSPTRISAYLRAEGTRVSEAEVKDILAEGYQHLYNVLPDDVQQIYALKVDEALSPAQDAQPHAHRSQSQISQSSVT
jgi:DNA-directed RNA polymerase specialized sigma24 family protein